MKKSLPQPVLRITNLQPLTTAHIMKYLLCGCLALVASLNEFAADSP
jgi:hypothetical protein